MKTIIGAVVFLFALSAVEATAADCPKTKQKNELEKQEELFNAYTPPKPAQSSGAGAQNQNMSQAQGNANEAKKVATECANKLREFEKKFKNLKKELPAEECEEENKKAGNLEKSAGAKAAQCEAAGGESGKQGDKNKDNEKKMGEGKAPEPPKPPEKKEEKKEDPAAKEKERQRKIKECKDRANNTKEIKSRNCVNDNGGVLAVQQLKQKQDECKQSLIFENQADIAKCEAIQPLP